MSGAAASRPPDGEVPARCPGPERLRQALEQEINGLRAAPRRCGTQELPAAPGLRWDQLLFATAVRHVGDMAHRGYFSHHTPEGVTPAQRGAAAGYDWGLYGENIASGQHSIDAALNSWLTSPAHCRALMNPDFRDGALACNLSANGILWALELGRRR